MAEERQPRLVDLLWKQRGESLFTDVTILGDNGCRVSAHKAILAFACPWMAPLLSDKAEDDTVIVAPLFDEPSILSDLKCVYYRKSCSELKVLNNCGSDMGRSESTTKKIIKVLPLEMLPPPATSAIMSHTSNSSALVRLSRVKRKRRGQPAAIKIQENGNQFHEEIVIEDNTDNFITCPQSPLQLATLEDINLHLTTAHPAESSPDPLAKNTTDNAKLKVKCKQSTSATDAEPKVQSEHELQEENEGPKEASIPTTESLITCPLCPLSFTSRGAVNNHLMYAHKHAKDVEMCSADIESVQSEQELFQLGTVAVKEEASKHNVRTDTTRIAERIRRISFHYKRHHNVTLLRDVSLYQVPLTKDSVHCTLCKHDDLVILSDNDVLEKHKAECHKVMDYFCDFCDVTRVRWNEYVTHLCSHVKSDVFGNFLCPYCDENITSTGNRGSRNFKPFTITHLYSHIQKKYFPNECEVCSERFYSENKLREHVNLRHTGARTYICPDCGKGFKTSGSRATHRRIHDSERQKLWRTRKSDRRSPNDVEGEYQCTLCDDVTHSYFEHSKHLNSHIVKSPDGRYICPWCHKDVTTKKGGFPNGHYYVHMPREYYREVCQYCEKRFPTVNKLKDHIAVIHNGSLDYECSYCDEKFATAIKKSDHEAVIHTGDTNYSCKFCSQKFLTGDKRSTHYKSAHPKT